MKRRALGQHYLVDQTVVEKMLRAADIKKNDRVLEIGTGKGVLTDRLAELCTNLEAYELDKANFELTKERVKAANMKLHLGDAFQQRADFDVLVSSLPYSKSSTFVEWLAASRYDRAVVLLQEDFAVKITAAPGSRGYRAVSAIVQISSEVILMDRVGRAAFSPRPRVDSRIVCLRPKRRLSKSDAVAIKLLFSSRRKKLRTQLKKMGYDPGIANRMGDKRVFELLPSEVLQVVNSAPR